MEKGSLRSSSPLLLSSWNTNKHPKIYLFAPQEAHYTVAAVACGFREHLVPSVFGYSTPGTGFDRVAMRKLLTQRLRISLPMGNEFETYEGNSPLIPLAIHQAPLNRNDFLLDFSWLEVCPIHRLFDKWGLEVNAHNGGTFAVGEENTKQSTCVVRLKSDFVDFVLLRYWGGCFRRSERYFVLKVSAALRGDPIGGAGERKGAALERKRNKTESEATVLPPLWWVYPKIPQDLLRALDNWPNPERHTKKIESLKNFMLLQLAVAGEPLYLIREKPLASSKLQSHLRLDFRVSFKPRIRAVFKMRWAFSLSLLPWTAKMRHTGNPRNGRLYRIYLGLNHNLTSNEDNRGVSGDESGQNQTLAEGSILEDFPRTTTAVHNETLVLLADIEVIYDMQVSRSIETIVLKTLKRVYAKTEKRQESDYRSKRRVTIYKQ
ncbi:uncharacterized protein BDR25DRAFT_355272 [Lindgomyces ingoldianus]|uniref:Uncharacterized protein n=1 Tax=Lindgomyces ingoldianus TaxID=673940 RepID=A0ACB6QVA4_9PLEO|nr:uncharacterized protein BDR25DRAFT_355272 [Lindgomyces ingoldianus]KAF2470792.1 hypothetical protein BDR25DRAFT_355272 [Lindgomyces ingoldianus]